MYREHQISIVDSNKWFYRRQFLMLLLPVFCLITNQLNASHHFVTMNPKTGKNACHNSLNYYYLEQIPQI